MISILDAKNAQYSTFDILTDEAVRQGMTDYHLFHNLSNKDFNICKYATRSKRIFQMADLSTTVY